MKEFFFLSPWIGKTNTTSVVIIARRKERLLNHFRSFELPVCKDLLRQIWNTFLKWKIFTILRSMLLFKRRHLKICASSKIFRVSMFAIGNPRFSSQSLADLFLLGLSTFYIIIHVLRTVLNKFPEVLTRRIFKKILSSFKGWSFLLCSWP